MIGRHIDIYTLYFNIFPYLIYSIRAHSHNLRNHSTPSFLSGVGEKVKHVAEAIGTAKGLHDIEKGIYQFGRMAAPVIAAML